MATTNHERVGKTMELLRQGLQPFIERELHAQHGKYWGTAVGWTRYEHAVSKRAKGRLHVFTLPPPGLLLGAAISAAPWRAFIGATIC